MERPNIKTPFPIAYFITPHGFGHAARACAVIQALRKTNPDIRAHIFTSVPEWFFTDSLGEDFNYYSFTSDIGLVQTTPFTEDLAGTAQKWQDLRQSIDTQTRLASMILKEIHCKAVFCDIAPTGILAAQLAKIPSFLIENFTWDFIYAGYFDLCPALCDHAEYVADVYARADFHIQAMPVCNPNERIKQVPPIFRPAKLSREKVRRLLGIDSSSKVIYVTTGGIPGDIDSWTDLDRFHDIHFILPGKGDVISQEKNRIWLPHHSPFYSPDVIHACDAVIAKLGYSTVAEVYSAGIPFGYIPRDSFPESPVLAEFVRSKLSGIELSLNNFVAGSWGELPQLLMSKPKTGNISENGADQVCDLFFQVMRG